MRLVFGGVALRTHGPALLISVNEVRILTRQMSCLEMCTEVREVLKPFSYLQKCLTLRQENVQFMR